MRCLVTGATGYIGKRLVAQLRLEGHQVISASRNRAGDAGQWIQFDIDQEQFFLPPALDVVFHLAATTRTSHFNVETEVRSAEKLMTAAVNMGARIVFVSSQTARPDAPTSYGIAKWQIEQLVARFSGVAVRPGLVYGGPECGLFGVLVNTVRTLPALPAFIPAPLVQPIHVDDLVRLLIVSSQSHIERPAVINAGAAQAIPFTTFLKCIADFRVRKLRLFIPFPVFAINAANRLMGKRLAAVTGIGRLVSLFGLPLMKTFSDLQRLGIELRPLATGMSKAGKNHRSRLIAEAFAMLGYIQKKRPSVGLAARYVRMVEALHGGRALGLPQLMLHGPALLGLIEKSRAGDTAFRTAFMVRLDAAVALGEASTQGAGRYLLVGRKSGFLLHGARVSAAVASEIILRLAAMMIRPLMSALIAAGSRER